MPSPSTADHPLSGATKNPAPTTGTRRKPRGTTLVQSIYDLWYQIDDWSNPNRRSKIANMIALGEGRVQPSVPGNGGRARTPLLEF